MQLKRLWDTDNKKIVFTEGPTGHQCQVWTDGSGNLYIYDMAQWLTYNGTSPEGKEYDRSNWEALTDQVVGFYDTDKPSELFSWDHGDDAYYQFVDWDGTVLKSGTVIEGGTPTAPANPTREATAQYTYTFAGWTPAVGPISKRTTYTATYTATLNEYTITWVDGDGKTLKTDTVAYGATPAYEGATPTKSSDSEYDYTWDGGWTPTVAAVTGNATYTATFTATAIIYAESVIPMTDKDLPAMLLGSSQTFTFNYLPANATNISNISIEMDPGASYSEVADVTREIISFGNGEATVRITATYVDPSGKGTAAMNFYLNDTPLDQDTYEFTTVVYEQHTVTFSSSDVEYGTVSPVSAVVPHETKVTAINGNVITLTNTTFNVTATCTATAIDPGIFSRWEEKVGSSWQAITVGKEITSDSEIIASFGAPCN